MSLTPCLFLLDDVDKCDDCKFDGNFVTEESDNFGEF